MLKKILILQPYLAPYRIDVYNYLARNFDLKLIYWYNQAPEQNFNLEILKKKCSFKYEYLNSGFIIKDRVIKFDIFKQILKFKPSVVVCHEYGFFTIISLLLCKFLKFKVIVNTDDNLEMLEGTRGIRKILRKLCLENVSGIISTNPISLAYLNNLFPKLKNNSIFYPILQDESYLRQELSYSLTISQQNIETFQLNGKKILLFVGRLADVKGVDILINAFKSLSEIDNNIVLIIVGTGPEEKKLKEIVERYKLEGKILFTGRIDGKELYSWYNIGQIFILPSRYEPFGAVINEALISGNFVLASNIVGSRFLLNNDNGLVFVNEDVESLAMKLKLLIGKISPISEIINVKESKSAHSFDYFTNNIKEFLQKQSS